MQNLNIPTIQQRFSVAFDYDVHFTTGLFRLDNPLLANVVLPPGELGPKKIAFVIDAGVLEHHPQLNDRIAAYARHHDERLTLVAPPLVVPGGEAVKNDPSLIDRLHAAIDSAGLCRHSYLIAIGGGSMLDMAGYAAATAHRGIRIIRVPTTVLAQNDAGIGVKNGINAFGKKNFLGTFKPPYAVLNDFEFLHTLDDRDWRSGIAEAVKVALIKDPDFFTEISTLAEALANRDMAAMQQLIVRCAQLHLNHIATSGDPFELGSSRPLDFGHWSAHKLEQLTDYALRHGEAVAIGIALDATYSYLLGWLTWRDWGAILGTLQRLGFVLYVPELAEGSDSLEHPGCIFRGLNEFREHLGGQLTLMLLQGIGTGVEVHEVDLDLYRKAIAMVSQWDRSSLLTRQAS
ncbi:MAG: 3-dehydroquinate synthase [Cyanobacteria bacterium P01_F01_bin.33]